MANKEHLRRLKKTIDGLSDFKGWNRWRAANRKIVPDLSGANLGEIDLIGDTNLKGADLSFADLFEASIEQLRLKGANLEGADLRFAQLWKADLRDANLNSADLTGASLEGADMRGANLFSARLENSKLAGARLEGATAGYTIFANCDLRDVAGLQTVRHEGPSTIGG